MKSNKLCSISKVVLTLAASTLFLGGCATWSTAQVDRVRPDEAAARVVLPERVALSEGDITDRKYAVIGDIAVTVNKTTVFHDDPTREQVDGKLREEAAALGADAVIFVRYGTVGMSMMSWGSLDGKGRAVRFVR